MYIGYIFAWGVALCSPLYAFLLGLVDITLPELSVRGYIPSLWCTLLIMFIEIVLFLCYTYHLDGIKYCKESRRYDTEWSTLQHMLPPRPTAAANDNNTTTPQGLPKVATTNTANTTQGISTTPDGVFTTTVSNPTGTPYSILSKEVIEERNETLRLVMDIQYPSPPPSLVQSRHGRRGRNGRGQTEYKHRFTHLSRSYQGFNSSTTTTTADAGDNNTNQQSQHIHRSKTNTNNKDDTLYETKGDGDNLDMAGDDEVNHSLCTSNNDSSSSSDDNDGDGDSTIPTIPSYKDSNTSIGLIVCELRKVYPPHTELSFNGVLTVLFSYGALILSQVRECLRVLVGRRQNMSGHNYDSIDNMNHTPTDINPTGDNTHLSELSSLDNRSATVVAVENICFNVRKGEIFGLLGSNGAG